MAPYTFSYSLPVSCFTIATWLTSMPERQFPAFPIFQFEAPWRHHGEPPSSGMAIRSRTYLLAGRGET